MTADDSLPMRLMESALYLLYAPRSDEDLAAAELVADAAANVVHDRIRAALGAPDSY